MIEFRSIKTHIMKTKLLLLLAFICQISFAQVSNANLVAYYSFDNTLVNAGPGGSNYNLSLFGSGTNPAYLASGGITGGSINNSGCYEFNTTITLQNSAFFNLLESNPNQSFSVSYWAYNNQAQSSSSLRTHFEMFGSMFARGGLAWGISTQNGNFSLTSAANVSHTIGVWNHIALVYDASALRLRMYVNGFAYNEVATPANTIYKYNNKFVIGGGTDGNGDNSLIKAFAGRIDEMYVFNRALQQTEVTALYNKEVPTSSCPTGNYTANSQTLVDLLAGCTTINGNLTISGSGITNLSSLSSLTTINGNLQIINTTNLTSLNGLSNLTTINGTVSLGNTNISNLDGISNLNTVSGIGLSQNNSLTNIQGLSNVSGIISGAITIFQNNNLTNLSGLQNITQASSINITENLTLQNLNGLVGITTLTNNISNTLQIQQNNALTSLDGLNNLTTFTNNGGVKIIGNQALTSIDALAQINNLILIDILDNSNLSTCAIASVCNLLNVNANNVFILDNGTNCSTKAVVQSFCSAPICPTGNVTLTTQAEVDAFVAQYPNCTEINGNLTINGFNIPNLSGLSNLTSITGELLINITINNSVNVTGLQNISSVGGKLTIYRIGNLTNVNFLSGLTTVGSIEIGNEILTNIQGLSNITGALSGGIFINGCNNLTSLNGLQNITSLGGPLNIIFNPLLTDLTGLQGLTTINNTIGGVYNLWINNNANLTSLNGLNNLISFTKTTDPNNITTTGFGIFSNTNLANINALSSISSTLDVIAITNNPQLVTCAINPICNKLSNTTTGVTISGNATGCESITVVQAACAALSSSDFQLESNLKIYPNPFNSQITFELGNSYENITVLIHDITGKQLYQNSFSGNQLVINNLGNLPSGMYVATIITENGTSITKKIVK